jgi:hypothetical protein
MGRPLTPPDVCDSQQVEAWLRSHGVSHSALIDIDLDMIDVKRSRTNQARPTPLVPESVDRFTVALKNGAIFPPIVVYPTGSKVVIIDGINREASTRKAGHTKIKAFIISAETPSETIQLMTVDANSHHGVAPDYRWRIKQAIHLLSIGFDVNRVATAAAVTASQIREQQRLVKNDARARALKITKWQDMPETSRLRLGALPSDPVFVYAARVAIDTGMMVEDVSAFVKEIRALPSEGTQIDKIKEIADSRNLEAKQRAALGDRQSIKSPKNNLVAGIGKIMHADPEGIANQVITDVEQQELVRRIEAATEHLMAIQIAIEERMKENQRDVG